MRRNTKTAKPEPVKPLVRDDVREEWDVLLGIIGRLQNLRRHGGRERIVRALVAFMDIDFREL